MSQPQLEELLSAYLDDEVTAEERKLVESALTTDPQLCQLYNDLRSLQNDIRSLPRHAPAVDLEMIVTQHLEAAPALSARTSASPNAPHLHPQPATQPVRRADKSSRLHIGLSAISVAAALLVAFVLFSDQFKKLNSSESELAGKPDISSQPLDNGVALQNGKPRELIPMLEVPAVPRSQNSVATVEPENSYVVDAGSPEVQQTLLEQFERALATEGISLTKPDSTNKPAGPDFVYVIDATQEQLDRTAQQFKRLAADAGGNWQFRPLGAADAGIEKSNAIAGKTASPTTPIVEKVADSGNKPGLNSPSPESKAISLPVRASTQQNSKKGTDGSANLDDDNPIDKPAIKNQSPNSAKPLLRQGIFIFRLTPRS